MAIKSLESLIDDWSKDAEKFVREALGVEKITKQQQKSLHELTFLVQSKIKASEDREKCAAKELEYAKKRGITLTKDWRRIHVHRVATRLMDLHLYRPMT